ncbi:hypothetical protein [Actinokineospora sp. NPDC004072]
MTADIDKSLRALRSRIAALEEQRAADRDALPARLIAPALAAAAVVLTALPWVTDRKVDRTLWGMVGDHGQALALLAAVLALAGTAVWSACAESVGAGAKAAAGALGLAAAALLVWLGTTADGAWWPAPWLLLACVPALVAATAVRR